MDDERLVGEFRASTLEPDLRDRFKSVALTHLARDRILSVETLAAELGLIPARPTRRPTPSPTASAAPSEGAAPPASVTAALAAGSPTPVSTATVASAQAPAPEPPTRTPPFTPTAAATPTPMPPPPTARPTETASSTPTSIPTRTPSATPVPPTATATPSPSSTATHTATSHAVGDPDLAHRDADAHPVVTRPHRHADGLRDAALAHRHPDAHAVLDADRHGHADRLRDAHTLLHGDPHGHADVHAVLHSDRYGHADRLPRRTRPLASDTRRLTATRTSTDASFTPTETATRTSPRPTTARTRDRYRHAAPKTARPPCGPGDPDARVDRYAATAARRPPVTPGVDIPTPRPIERVMPVYPEQALKERVRGVVVLRVLVSETGQPIEVTVKTAARKDLTDAAVAAAKQWRFEPARAERRRGPGVRRDPVPLRGRPVRADAVPGALPGVSRGASGAPQ